MGFFFLPTLLLLKRKPRHGVSGRMRGHCKALWGAVKVQESAIEAQSVPHFPILPSFLKFPTRVEWVEKMRPQKRPQRRSFMRRTQGKTEATQSIIGWKEEDGEDEIALKKTVQTKAKQDQTQQIEEFHHSKSTGVRLGPG